MTFDFDDFHESNHRLDLLEKLKAANPAFRCTLFAVPGLGSDRFWGSVPVWCELAVHGFMHPHPRECEDWTRDQTAVLLRGKPARFVEGFKAPGWQISDGTYQALLAAGWWVADQHLEDDRRPAGLRTYLHEDGGNWHGHIQDVCGNGLAETFPELLRRVKAAKSFEFASEAANPWGTS